MKHPCMNCEQADMARTTKDVVVRHDGFHETVPTVWGWHCPHCGEVEFLNDDGARRFGEALDRLEQQEREWLAQTRKRLKLTQKQAADLTGGGKNAFSRYERGEAKPMAAVINLFRLLDKHPELLDEVRAFG